MSAEFPFTIWKHTPDGTTGPHTQHRTREAAEARLAALTLIPGLIPQGVSYEIRPAISSRTNLDDALEIVHEIQKVNGVQRELKAAFARSELDGGVKAAPRHPLYIECEERLAVLRDQLMMVI